MKNIMENKKLLFGILAGFTAGLLVGFIFFAFLKPVAVEHSQPKMVAEHQFKVGAELTKTYYQVGEKISVKPYLINVGEQVITVFGGDPILLFKVYDAENRQVFSLPEIQIDILAEYTLKPQMPYYAYYVEERRRESYTFALDRPGRYKVVAWTKFSLDERHAYQLRIYADPIWIWVGEYYGWSTYGQCQRDNDCFVSGCNTEVCQSRAEEPRVTICILPDKPTPKQLNYGCRCVNQKCQWSK